MADVRIIIGAATAISTAILGCYLWVAKHITNNRRHPDTDDLVFKDVCELRGQQNTIEHQHLKEGIETAIKRSDEQHYVLKASVEKGFDNVITLIKNGNK